mgnify:CR=1 FL=1
MKADERATALEKCLSDISAKHKIMIRKYYTDGFTMEELGKSLQRSAGSVAVALHRIRIILSDCIRKQLT